MASKNIKFSIEGMHCGSCASGIQLVLQQMDGVMKASADYDSKSGEVEFDDSKVKLEDIIKNIEDLGYKAKVVG